MSKFELTAIRATGATTYELLFQRADEQKTFVMSVEGTDIKVVTTRHDFSIFVGFNTGPLGPIFKAVMAFHEARQVPFPPLTSSSPSDSD